MFAVLKSLQKRQTPGTCTCNKKRGKAVKRSFGECLTEDEVVLRLQTEEKEKQKKKAEMKEKKQLAQRKKEQLQKNREVANMKKSACTEKENGTK